MTPDTFRQRYAHVSFADGGIILDRQTGVFSHLNLSALVMCAAMEQCGELSVAIETAATTLGISHGQATRDFSIFLNQLRFAKAPDGVPAPLHYVASQDGFDFYDGDVHVVHVDHALTELRLAAATDSLPQRPIAYLFPLAPKLVTALGWTVLHAASCINTDGLLLISGKSGAGKTTTARALARHGLQLFSEDLILLSPDAASPAAIIGAEHTIRSWAYFASEALLRTPGIAIDLAPLTSISSGPSVRLRSAWFIDASRRGNHFEVRPLPASRAALLILENQFFGSQGSADRHLRISAGISSSVTSYQVSVPDGLDRLDTALATYMTNSAS